MGHSDKREDVQQRGQWGEGLDLGILALVRAGRQVKIRNGNETWTPRIVKSDLFDADVPVIFTRKVGACDDYVAQLEITEEEWESFLPRFLDLSPCAVVQVTRDYSQVGSLITDPERSGWVYCKGIWVQTRDDLMYGYNLINVQLDRDRKMPAEYSLRNQIGNVWVGLIVHQDGFASRAYELLEEDEHTDCNSLPDDIQYSTCSTDAQRVPGKLAEVFEDKHHDCLPVAEQGHLTRLSHYGRAGVMVTRKLGRILERHYGSFAAILDKVAKLSFTPVQLYELSDEEEEVYWRGLSIFCEVSGLFHQEKLERLALQVRVVDFQDKDTLAAFDPTKMAIYVGRKMLSTEADFLGSVIHEKAHEYTMAADGTLIQAQVEREMWRNLTRILMTLVPMDWPNTCATCPQQRESTIR